MRSFFALVTALLALLAAPLAAQPVFPELTGRVVDGADLLTPAEEEQLTARLAALEEQSERQLVVATVPDLQGYDISDYGYQLGREWGIGDAERNDGALLIVAPNERRVRIEVGYGLEPYLTDALSSIIIRDEITPRFRENDMAGGIFAGTDALIRHLELPEEEAREVVRRAQEAQQEESGGFPIGGLIWFAFIFFFFILPMLRGGRRRKRRYRRGPWGDTARDIILWEAGKAIARGFDDNGGGWGGGGFGGGGFGGGGFSGGGGSFGGGGASGGW